MIGQQHVNTIREKLTKRADMNWCIKTLLNNHILSFKINPESLGKNQRCTYDERHI